MVYPTGTCHIPPVAHIPQVVKLELDYFEVNSNFKAIPHVKTLRSNVLVPSDLMFLRCNNSHRSLHIEKRFQIDHSNRKSQREK